MNPNEQFLARLMNILAEKYRNRLVLKGGMLLRLLNSPRETLDLDYAWIREKKRNLFAQELKETLEGVEGISITDLSVNSRGIFIEAKDRLSGGAGKIEINVVDELRHPPRPLTNARLVEPYSLPASVIATMDLSEALSHKIAASLERDLARDLYDLMILEPLTPFDEETLLERLAKLEINRNKPKKVSVLKASKMLKEKSDALTEEKIQEELGSYLSTDQSTGLEMVIRASVSRLIQRMQAMPS